LQYSDKQIQDLLDGIREGSITEYDLPDDLYEAIGNYLQKGLFQGFGGKLDDFSGKDYELLSQLQDNVWMFSAAKTYQEVLDIRGYLYDADGNLRSVREFNELGRAAFSNWNDNYGRTEYETAIGQAQSAVGWNQIQEQKDVLPTLVFDTQGNACPECAPYDGFAAPVDDPVWDWLTPLLHFNCMCILRQEDENYPLSDKKEYDATVARKDNVPEAFQMNPGKDGYVFSPSHPYFEVSKGDKDFAKENFGLAMPEKPEPLPFQQLNIEQTGIAKLSRDEIVNHLKAAGIPSDLKGDVSIYNNKKEGVIEIHATNEGISMARVIDPKAMTIQNEYFKIEDSSPYKGKGAEIFANQVKEASNQDYKSISAHAAGKGTDYEKRGDWNGYYTWPRLGYLPDKSELYRFEGVLEDFNRINNTDVKNLGELMATKEGQSYWKKRGFEFSGYFDLKKNSYSQKTLKNYIRAKGKK
jgi:hypothetical protein